MILDSGTRREFATGAVRDIQEGKGRFDLMPLMVMEMLVGKAGEYTPLRGIETFRRDGCVVHLYYALRWFANEYMGGVLPMLMEVARHFEAGAEKYGERNWEKGINIHCYIDSAIRHYVKYLDKWEDEPHAAAFCWNLMCCIWTMENKPELDDYTERQGERDDGVCK